MTRAEDVARAIANAAETAGPKPVVACFLGHAGVPAALRGDAGVPLGRLGRPDDAAGLALFLASRAGAYLTGAVIPLDGGLTGCA